MEDPRNLVFDILRTSLWWNPSDNCIYFTVKCSMGPSDTSGIHSMSSPLVISSCSK